MATFQIAQVTVADSNDITQNNIPAFWEDPNWILAWQHTTMENHILQVAKRTPRNLITDREHKRHQKAIDISTGSLVGYARWLLPDSHARLDVWPEAVVPAVSVEEEEDAKRLAETAVWKPNEESDVLLTRMVNARKELLAGKNYLRLDYLAVHPKNQGKGIATALVRSGVQEAEKLDLDIFVTAFRVAVGVYKRLGFRVLRDFVEDDSRFGGTGEVYYALMVYERKGTEG
ncbi:acetyltransferase protein [Rutstroemia sp. NJR-2017a WRK4]|nr:acetyltransferase protein [Rutstroemia sp. NJR-2017a WRK4]